MPTLNDVREILYRDNFAPSKEQAEKFVAFDPEVRYLRNLQGEVLRNSTIGEDPVAIQMRNTFFQDLSLGEARKRFILAANYGARQINEFFSMSFGRIVLPFNLSEIREDVNLTEVSRKAQEKYWMFRANANGRHSMVGANGDLLSPVNDRGKPRNFYDYGLLAEAFNVARAVGVGYNILKILQSAEYSLHRVHHDSLASWVNSSLTERLPLVSFEERRKSPISILSKMVYTGKNMGTIKDLSGTRLVVRDRNLVGKFLREVKNKVRGPSRIEGFERTRERTPEDTPFYDPRFDCDKLVLRPSIPYQTEHHSFDSDEVASILGKNRIRLPVEVQVVTEDALRRMNEDLIEVPAHKLYKHRKALAFWQIVNPWEIFGPLMVQNNSFLEGKGLII